MSDLHGCYDELMMMLKKINFLPEDTLVIAGDYIDRGEQNYEMLEWVRNPPDNVVLLKGNHDAEFVSYVDKLERHKYDFEDEIRDDSIKDTNCVLRYFFVSGLPFDHYLTIDKLVTEKKVTLAKLKEWSSVLERLPYTYETQIDDRHFIVVHAGYCESKEQGARAEAFYMYARDEAYLFGGKRDSIIVAGHTPTIETTCMTYTGGTIFSYYNPEINCTYYDVDCGIVFRKMYGEGNLACLRLEDEKEFYLYDDVC